MAPIRIHHDDLRRLFADIFSAKGMSQADADTVADMLAWANVRGVDGHGGVRIPGYLDYIDRGALDPRAQPFQDLIDRILYRLAGLSDAEAAGLESRLGRML